MDLYSKTTLQLSKELTRAYTSSFYAGMRLLHPVQRLAIYGIYGFVRVADEIVDTFFETNQQKMLEEFKLQTYQAIEQGISSNPILHSYQWVVNHYRLDPELTHHFFASMEMDLHHGEHDRESYERYIYGSAEVVGLMCLAVFYRDDRESYDRLKEPARKLGQAFQKINFLRDIRDDFDQRKRTYFPGLDLEVFTSESKKQIEAEVEMDFQEALPGIRQLHRGVRLGVYLAYRYYYQLLLRIQKQDPEQLLSGRTSIGRWNKIRLLIIAYMQYRSGRI